MQVFLRKSSTSARTAVTGKKVTLQSINKMFRNKEPIAMMTAHDYPSGLTCQNAGVDVCLVGDSLAMVALGYESTNEISLAEMIHHAKAVARGCKSPFLVGDMPFGTYERSADQALDNAVEYMRSARVEAVKMEGGAELKDHVKKLTTWGIPVVGHIGLTPQRHIALGGYKVQGKTLQHAKALYSDALALQEAGVCMLVIEAVPHPVASFITSKLNVPTIGIGAGPGTSGQVLVQMDTLGMFDRFLPSFCKVYGNVGQASTAAIRQYCDEVKARKFPALEDHSYKMKSDQELKDFQDWVNSIDK